MRSVAGPSGIDTGTDSHYRYMIITGHRGRRSLMLLRAETHRLTQDGWRLQPVTMISNQNQTTTVGIATPGTVVILDGPRDIYVALQYLTGVRELDTAGLGPAERPLGPLNDEMRDGVPLLGVVLGHQNNELWHRQRLPVSITRAEAAGGELSARDTLLKWEGHLVARRVSDATPRGPTRRVPTRPVAPSRPISS